jgi:glycosyltransferase involved in cell wall biosynthesis
MNLIFFTLSFPYSKEKEDSFILPELPVLSFELNKIIIVPLLAQGAKVDVNYPNIYVDNSFAIQQSRKSFIQRLINAAKSIFSLVFLKSIAQDKALFSPSKICHLAIQLSHAMAVKIWLTSFFANDHTKEPYILYTYWFDYATIGCAFYQNTQIVKKITRAHRYDVFEFSVPQRSKSLRRFILSRIDAVFVVSKAGATYLQHKYPQFSERIQHCYLGINQSSGKSAKSKAGELNLFSCSYIVPVKRVLLLIEYINALAKRYPAQQIVWTHAGDGPFFEQLKQQASQIKLPNLKIKLLGAMENREVKEYYACNPVDVFLSLSESEGLPVSMMEAQSFGVPIVATNVGGVNEIVLDGKTGFLLPESPMEEEFIEKVAFFINNPDALNTFRLNSLENWEEHFNASKNHKEFCSQITKY